MAKPKPSLLDAVLAEPALSRCGPIKPWWERLEPEQLQQLIEIRAKYKAGELFRSQSAIAKAVSKAFGINVNRNSIQHFFRFDDE